MPGTGGVAGCGTGGSDCSAGTAMFEPELCNKSMRGLLPAGTDDVAAEMFGPAAIKFPAP